MLLNRDRLISKNNYLKEFIIELITCSLCQNIFKNPYDCLCCNLTYCYDCINQYIRKNKKCPNEPIDTTTDFDSQYNLKQTSLNLINFIRKLRFSCINRLHGCNEELELNDLEVHESACQGIDDSRGSFSLERNSSIVSFKNKSYQIKSNEVKTIYPNNIEDKLEKIMLQLNEIQSAIPEGNRPSLYEFPTETPKFSLGFNSRPDSAYTVKNKYSKDKINFNNNTFYSQNLNTALDHEKIFSELEILNDKIAKFEEKLEFINPYKKNNIEANFPVDKILKIDNGSWSKNNLIPQSSANPKINPFNSMQNKDLSAYSPQKEKNMVGRDSKKYLGSPPAVKKIMIKTKVDSKHNLVHSPTKNTPNFPKENLKFITRKKEISPEKQNESRDKLSKSSDDNIIKFEEIYEMYRTIIKKLDLSICNSNDIYEINKDNFKEYINSDFLKELKNCFLEITLDSYDVYIEKVRELFEKIN